MNPEILEIDIENLKVQLQLMKIELKRMKGDFREDTLDIKNYESRVNKLSKRLLVRIKLKLKSKSKL